MEEKEIATVSADELEPNDLIRVGGFYETVKRIDESPNDSNIIQVFTVEGEDEPWEFPWDERITLYGY